ncbi:phosphoglycolate phosphatase [Halobacteriales archaeon SW_7_68_16]|nr:MAG: phosphoglycolate phosphatase [Halobacteriales archaeon SW_7_68_16]
MTPPLALDIDGTLTRPGGGIDPRVFGPIREWPAPVVLATGEAFPYPVALCTFLGIAERVVAENGGVAYADDDLTLAGDPDAARAVAADLRAAGYDLYGEVDTVNRWRETELAVPRDIPVDVVEAVAADHGLSVVDSEFAYHVTSPAVDKGRGLRTVADILGIDAGSFIAIGDSANDVEAFAVARRGVAVANAADEAKTAADTVTTGSHANGVLDVLDRVRGSQA